MGVYDMWGLDTEAHQAKSPESFDFTLSVLADTRITCRTLALQGMAEQTFVAMENMLLVGDCFQFLVPPFTEQIEINNLTELSMMRWQGKPNSQLFTTTDTVVEFPQPGWWYLVTNATVPPVINARPSPSHPLSPLAVRYDDPIFIDWQLPNENATLFVLELTNEMVGGELRLAPQAALFRSLNLSEAPFIEAGGSWFRPTMGTYFLLVEQGPQESVQSEAAMADPSLLGLSHAANQKTLQAAFASKLEQGDTVAYMAQCPQDCNHRGSCFVSRGVVAFAFCTGCVRFSGLACEEEVVSLGAYTGMVLLLVFSNLAILPAVYKTHKMKLRFEAAVYALVCLASSLYHLCDEGCYCVATYRSLHLLDFLLSFYAIVVTVVYSAGHAGWTKDVANLVALLVLVFANTQDSAFWEYGPFGLVLAVLVVGPLVRDRALLFPPFHDRLAWGGLAGALCLLLIALICQYAVLSNANYFYVHSIWHFCIQLCPLLCMFWRRGPEPSSCSLLSTDLQNNKRLKYAVELGDD